MTNQNDAFNELNLKLNTLYSGDYKVISSPEDYKGVRSLIKVLHTKCGNSFSILSNEITRSRCQDRFKKACKYCIQKAFTLEEITEKVKIASNGKIQVMSYNNSYTPCKLQCLVCTHIWERSLSAFFTSRKKTTNHGCPICSKTKLTTEIVALQITEKFNGNLVLKSEYINLNTPLLIYCNKCNNTFEQKKEHLYLSTMCKLCNYVLRDSNGVREIVKFLTSNNIKHKREIRFDECKYKRQLPFDFFIPLNETEDDYLLIEYDGGQHFHGWNYSKKDLAEINTKDSIKTAFCKKYKIPFLRLNCNDSHLDINSKLETFLAHYKLF